MGRLPKVQGAVHPKLAFLFNQWKSDNGYRSQGEALTALLSEYFAVEIGDNEGRDNGDNGVTQTTGREGYHQDNGTKITDITEPPASADLEGVVTDLKNRLEELEKQMMGLEKQMMGLSCPITPAPTPNTDDNADNANYDKDKVFTAPQLAEKIGISSRTLRGHLQKIPIGKKYLRGGKTYKVLNNNPYLLELLEEN